MDHLQAGVALSFAVLPESSALVEPGEGAFDDPPFGHDGEGVQLAAFGNLHRGPKLLLDCVAERLTRVAAIGQYAGDLL